MSVLTYKDVSLVNRWVKCRVESIGDASGGYMEVQARFGDQLSALECLAVGLYTDCAAGTALMSLKSDDFVIHLQQMTLPTLFVPSSLYYYSVNNISLQILPMLQHRSFSNLLLSVVFTTNVNAGLYHLDLVGLGTPAELLDDYRKGLTRGQISLDRHRRDVADGY